MSLRRLKPFPTSSSSIIGFSSNNALALSSSSSIAVTTTTTCAFRYQSSTGKSSEGTGANASKPNEDIDIEAELASADRASFSKMRNSLLGGSESASVYSQPRGAGTGFEDPAQANSRFTRLFIESVVDTDALGGQHRSDYYRDPIRGHAPQHAPRNFGAGGHVDAFHPLSSLEYEASFNQRAGDDDHSIQQSASSNNRTRQALLRQAQQGGGLQAHPNRFGPGGDQAEDGDFDSSSPGFRPSQNLASSAGESIYAQHSIESADPNATGFFEQAASPKTPRNLVGSLQQQANNNNNSRLAWLDAQSEHKLDTENTIIGNRESELEFFRSLHGERDRERHEEGRFEHFVQSRSVGYDVDRINARTRGKLPFRGIPNLVPSGSASEAHSEVRRNNISSEHATYQEQAAANTTAAAPLHGEALTRHLVETAEVRQRNSEKELLDDWRQKTGRGRVNPLVADSGPDQRPQQLGKNDERLLRAGQFQSNAYVKNDAERRRSVYNRRMTKDGVGHLLESEFDRRRRADLLADGKQDPIERSHMHLGQPLREQIDERARYRSNNRPQRPLEYFLPFPKQTDMLHLQSYSDVEGFPLFAGKMANTRLNPFEWDLFIRYRAHAAQRRDIALKNGLEPRPNESVAERDARRAALDELCEKTPFNPSAYIVLDQNVSIAPVSELRQWFGAYWLPSPTLTATMLGKTLDAGLHLVEEKRPGYSGDDKAPLDDREHVLSGRYLNKLLTVDTYNSRLQRQSIKEQYLGRAPEPEIMYRVSGSTLKHFTPDQKNSYEEYIKRETEKHVEKWNGVLSGRRFVPSQNSYGRLMKAYVNDVTNIRALATGETVVASAQLVQEELAKAINNSPSSGGDKNKNNNNNIIKLDGNEYLVMIESTRAESFVDIKLENGSIICLPQPEWNRLPEEHNPTGQDGSLDVNNHINVGMPEKYSYNRLNYVETQDVLWESRVTSGEEGWTTAIHPDGLTSGLPIRARRTFAPASTTAVDNAPRYGDFERATVGSYEGKPFFNPTPREVSVIFHDEYTPITVPLSNVSIWQASWSGQERTKPLNTNKLNGGIRRFVNMQDPKGEKDKFNAISHFLDKYLTSKQQTELSQKWRYSKSIADIDQFTTFDINRPHNHRLISGTGVKHYIRSGFIHRYTPWELILSQEAEAPIIDEQLRKNESEGTSFYFSPNRFWRYKRRPYGYIKNHPNEVRDLFQYIDGSVGWDKAKQIRTHWEVRDHHPMPAFHRPYNVHRNQPKILPAHLWESDKKTGKVKVLKDSLKDYKPLNVYPAWTNL